MICSGLCHSLKHCQQVPDHLTWRSRGVLALPVSSSPDAESEAVWLAAVRIAGANHQYRVHSRNKRPWAKDFASW